MSNKLDSLDETLCGLSHLNLTDEIDYTQEGTMSPISGGGFSDVYCLPFRPDTTHTPIDPTTRDLFLEICASSKESGQPVKVAVKRLRFFTQGSSEHRIREALTRELRIWVGLSHQNVLPILGFTLKISPYPSFVSLWMDNGTLLDYMKEHRNSMKIMPMVQGVASGLCYLHSMRIIHSDLKCSNIFVSPNGKPLLADFGLSREAIMTATGGQTSTKDPAGSLRWMAPELLSHDNAKFTKKSDVWALGMTIVELITGEPPFGCNVGQHRVMCRIMDYDVPKRPLDILQRTLNVQQIWDLCESCWKPSSERLNMEDICSQLENPLSGSRTGINSDINVQPLDLPKARPKRTKTKGANGSKNPHKPRPLVVCLDGTGTRGNNYNPNVAPLYSMLQKGNPQLVYYYPGIGTYASMDNHQVQPSSRKV